MEEEKQQISGTWISFVVVCVLLLTFVFIVYGKPTEIGNEKNSKKDILISDLVNLSDIENMEFQKVEPVLNTHYWNKVKEDNLIISFTPDSPPFCISEGINEKTGKPIIKGFNRSLAEILCKKLGIKFNYVVLPLYEQINKLLKGEIDIIMAPLTRTSTRAIKISFSESYYNVTQGVLLKRGYLFVPKNNSREPVFIGKKIENFFNLAWFKDFSIAVKKESSNEKLCKYMLPKDFKISAFKTNEEAIKALIEDKCLAMVADHTYILQWKARNPQHDLKFTSITGISTQDSLGIGIRKGDTDFLNWLNLFIEELKGNKTIEVLKKHYIDNSSWLKEKGK